MLKSNYFVMFFVISTFQVKAIDWNELSQQEYINELTQCQLTIKKIKWSHSIWPKENKKPKPLFTEVYNEDQAKQKVMELLKMQTLLSNEFNSEIGHLQLQNELNRMARNTRDAARLKELYNALDNNPRSIAECIARPNLIKKILSKRYSISKNIHAEVRQQAQFDLDGYLFDNSSIADISLIEFTLEKDLKHTEGSIDEKYIQIELELKEFDKKMAEINNKKSKISYLEEKQFSFIYQQVISQTAKNIKIKVLSWKKDSIEQWMKDTVIDIFTITQFDNKLTLPKIMAKGGGEFNKTGSLISDSWYMDNTPDGRYQHTAIWTGTEMIVWGGRIGQNAQTVYLNTGGRYDPVTDNWVNTTTTLAPNGRTNHTAIWSGTEMIIWGGYYGDNVVYYNTGGRYEPITDIWVSTTTTLAAGGRTDHTAIWTGDEMIVWGGEGNGPGVGNELNTGGRYDPNTDSWSLTQNTGAPQERVNHIANWTGTEMIVWGGTNGQGANTSLNSGSRYNPIANSWSATTITGAPSAGIGYTTIWTGQEMIVWSGFEGGKRYDPVLNSWIAIQSTGAPSVSRYTAVWSGTEMIVWSGTNNSGGSYNINTDSWSSLSSPYALHIGERGHTAVWTGTEMIVWGGKLAFDEVYYNTGGRYNPIADNWITIQAETPDIPSIRSSHTSIWTGTEMIIWGGYEGSHSLNTGGRYDPIADYWNPTQSMGAPDVRSEHTAIWSGTEMIVWGGENSSSTSMNTGGKYNPVSDTWLVSSVAPIARTKHTAIWTGTEMIIWGGSSTQNTGSRYNPMSDSWVVTTITSAPTARGSDHTAIWTGTEMIIWGGRDGTGNANTGGRYNPNTDSWNPTSLIGAASNRYRHTAIWSGTEMIIWGGRFGATSSILNTGGRYNPMFDSWDNAQTQTFGAPTPRDNHTAVWAGSEMIVWGGNGGGDQNTGGRYDPMANSWIDISNVATPKARANHSVTWTGSEMIVWGGKGEGYQNSGGRYSPTEDSWSSTTTTETPKPDLTTLLFGLVQKW